MGEKTKTYRIESPYYRARRGSEPCRYYEGGALVTIPADEKPARGWKEVEEPAVPPPATPSAPAPTPAAPESGKGKRPADRSI